MIRVSVAIFDSLSAATMTTVDMSTAELHEMAVTTAAAKKEDLPVFVYGRFGGNRTADGSLRHDANLLARTGWVVDHDAGAMAFDEAKARVEAAGLACFGYTTGRHSQTAPRWRLAGPFAKEITAAELPRMMSRINGVVGGVAAPESGRATQSWFIGRVNGALFDSFVTVDDECLDQASELDTSAIPIQGGPAPKPKLGKKGTPDYGELSRDELKELILNREHDFGPANELLRRDAYDGIQQADAEANLRDLYDEVPATKQDRAWSKARGSISRWAQYVYAGVARRKGKLFRNLVTFFREDEQCRGAIRRNEFTQEIEIAGDLPLIAGQPLADYRPLLDPEDILDAVMLAQENGFPSVGKLLVRDALISVARRRSCHPPREWLRGLEWDGKERIKHLFGTYFPSQLPAGSQARDDRVSYYEHVAACVLVGAVARVELPGCKVDCLPVLIGKQGWNKSQGIRALVPDPAWFSDDLSTALIDRDTKESLIGKWVIELSEFPHVKKEIEKVKAFFARQSDRYRRAYGAGNRDWKRQCVFIASTNELEFIDLSGNRRFWPIPLSEAAKLDKIAHDRDQLWAEAVHWYDQDYKWWLPPSIETLAATFQRSFIEDDPWTARVEEWLEGKYPPNPPGQRQPDSNGEWPPFVTHDVLVGYGFSLTPGERNFITRGDEMRMARVLKRLGYCQTQCWVNGFKRRWWFPEEKAPASE